MFVAKFFGFFEEAMENAIESGNYDADTGSGPFTFKSEGSDLAFGLEITPEILEAFGLGFLNSVLPAGTYSFQ